MKLLLKLVLAALLVLVGVLVGRTFMYANASSPAPVPALARDTMVSDSAAAERLARAVRFPTVSWTDSAPPREPFLALRHQLEVDFPLVHRTLSREIVPPYNLLYTWRGTDSTLPPVVLMGHMDVVPVEAAVLAKWHHAPFSGDIADGFIWGRGTLDDKVSVLAALEATETLIAEGFHPARTVYLAFGDDEEVAGSGADSIVQRLRARGIHPEFVMDEGGIVVRGMFPGVSRPVAVIGVAEKGYASVDLTVDAPGGHSSMPPKETAVGILAAGIVALERHPFPAHLSGPTAEMLDAVGPSMPFGPRLVFANRWLFDPVLVRQLAATPSTSAMLRTTTAPTMFEGSPKDNVLPQRARAVVNFRIRPGETVASVLEHVNSVIADPRVVAKVEARSATEPSPVSDTASAGFRAISQVARGLIPDLLVTPYLVVGGTDARHYAAITPNAYRFLPIEFEITDVARVHGNDERIGVANYGRAVRFVRALLRTTLAGASAK